MLFKLGIRGLVDCPRIEQTIHYSSIPCPFALLGAFGKGVKFFSRKCENIPMFGTRFVIIFSRVLERKIPLKTLPPSIEIKHSHKKKIFPVTKRPKYLYHYPKPPPLSTAAAADHRLPPATLCHLYQGYF